MCHYPHIETISCLLSLYESQLFAPPSSVAVRVNSKTLLICEVVRQHVIQTAHSQPI